MFLIIAHFKKIKKPIRKYNKQQKNKVTTCCRSPENQIHKQMSLLK